MRFSRGQDVMAACGQLALLESNDVPGKSNPLADFAGASLNSILFRQTFKVPRDLRLSNPNRSDHSSGNALAPITEEKIRAASGAEP